MMTQNQPYNQGNDSISDTQNSNQEPPRPPDAGCSGVSHGWICFWIAVANVAYFVTLILTASK